MEWVKRNNDSDFINCLLNMDSRRALEHAQKNKSACSAGAAAAAVKYAELNGVSAGVLMEYMTSYDIQPAESFVGYAGIIF